tara:strand:- start:14563 stop:14805 length:243 start_codon:yes stop_codon:yes gene_type:complete
MRWKSKKKPLVLGLSECVERFAYFPRQMEEGTWVWLEKYIQNRSTTHHFSYLPWKGFIYVWRNGHRYTKDNKEKIDQDKV